MELIHRWWAVVYTLVADAICSSRFVANAATKFRRGCSLVRLKELGIAVATIEVSVARCRDVSDSDVELHTVIRPKCAQPAKDVISVALDGMTVHILDLNLFATTDMTSKWRIER